jgi:hypothetical protein
VYFSLYSHKVNASANRKYYFQVLVYLSALYGTSLAQNNHNVFFPGSASYISSPISSQARNDPSISNRLSTTSKIITSSTPRPEEERRILEAPKPGEAPLNTHKVVKPLDFIPTTQFTTPQPLMKDIFANRPQFFSSFNRPGLFGLSPFGLNDFNLQTFPQFNSGPDFSVFNSGSNNNNNDQPKSFHYRREFNDKDGYTPWVDAGPKRPPTGINLDRTGQQQFPGPNFHQRYDLGPDGFFDLNKDNKNANGGFTGKTQAIMKVVPKNAQNAKSNIGEGGNNDLQERFQQLGNSNYNFNSFPKESLAQNLRSLRWPGQN